MYALIQLAGAGRLAPQSPQSAASSGEVRGVDLLVNEEGRKRTGAPLYGDPIPHPNGIVEHRVLSRFGKVLSGFVMNGAADFPPDQFFRHQQHALDEIRRTAEICRNQLISYTFPAPFTVVEFAFATDSESGTNAWAVIEVDGQRLLFYMGGRTDFMLAVFASLSLRNLAQLEVKASGWIPLIGVEHKIDIFSDKPEHPIACLNDSANPLTTQNWGPVRMHPFPQGCFPPARGIAHLLTAHPQAGATAAAAAC